MDATTYFVRHTDELAVSNEFISKLDEADRIAIHYPGDRGSDSRSLDPSAYGRESERRAVAALVELARDGGYVWAEYRTSYIAKIGYVAPGTPVELLETTWTEPDPSRVAVLKTLPLSRFRSVPRHKLLSLRAARPRQGTICRWRKCRDTVQRLVDGEALSFALELLAPDQLETACAEFLREPHDAELPCLRWLLMPIGRTLQDVDIYGLATDGRRIYAQVTFHHLNSAGRKIEALKSYKKGGHVLLFCQSDQETWIDGVHVVPLSRIESWLGANPTLTHWWTPSLDEDWR